MTLKELLDLELVHDNVKIYLKDTQYEEDYLFKAIKVFSRPVRVEDFKFNKQNIEVKTACIEDYLNREVHCITGAKQSCMTIIQLY